MTGRLFGKTLLLSSSFCIFTFTIQNAHAAFFALREQSAYSQGASFAGASAQVNALSSSFFNPSIITEFEGLTVEGTLSVILPFTDADTSLANANTGNATIDATRLAAFGNRVTTDNIGKEALVPGSYLSYQINDKLWAGFAINAPFGLGTRSDPGSLESLSSQEFSALSFNFQPSLAYKFNKRFSVAVGLQAQYFQVEQSANQLDTSNLELNADGFSFGALLGATFKPTDKTLIGVGYRSQMTVDVSGDITSRNTGGVLGVDTNLGSAEAEIALPDIVNVGVSHKFTDRFTGLAQFSWENWSRLDSVSVTNASGATAAEFDFNLSDSFFYAVGGEYDLTDSFKLRAGVAYETSPTNDEDRSLALPDNDRLWFSAGGSYNIRENIELDFAFTWVRVERDTEVGNRFQSAATTGGTALPLPLQGTAIASGTADSDIFIFSVGNRIRF